MSKKMEFNMTVFLFGLKKSLYNYMQHICLDDHLQTFFEQKIPNTSIHKNYIHSILVEPILKQSKPTTKVFWIGNKPQLSFFTKSKKGNNWQMASLAFQNETKTFELIVSKEQGIWLSNLFDVISIDNIKEFQFIQQDFEKALPDEDFELFWHNKVLKNLEGEGLILL